MLSRNLKRVLLDSRWPLPPTFLLPWVANLSTATQTPITSSPPSPNFDVSASPRINSIPRVRDITASHITSESPPTASSLSSSPPQQSDIASPPALSDSVRSLLPRLQAQAPHYITAHIYGKHYLLTQGDTIRLPFLMHDVEPGDVLRLNCAINIGSRDYTLKAASPGPQQRSPTMDTRNSFDTETGTWASQPTATPNVPEGFPEHFIPNIAKGKHSYLDERLFVCRAVVMGVDSEPLRIKEKTKRRQRKVKKVKSKHRFTILKVKELRIRSMAELDSGSELD